MINPIEEAEFQRGQIAEFQYTSANNRLILYDSVWDARKGIRLRKLSEQSYDGVFSMPILEKAIRRHYEGSRLLRPLRVHAREYNSEKVCLDFVINPSR